MRWILEPGVSSSGETLRDAALRVDHRVTTWSDDWWLTGVPPFRDENVVFQGSLGNAARISAELTWSPGSYCDVAAFCCSSWYTRAAAWLLQTDVRFLSASDLVASPPPWPQIFVRPDSPLKPFSGRVLARENLSLSALDFGFYYDDPALAVVAAPVKSVGREWRYVVVDGQVIAGSAYRASDRRSMPDAPGDAWDFAQQIAASLVAPMPVYVLDICESEGRLYLLELNPFGGADLYACDPDAIVSAVAAACERPDAR